jgi:hypothetical protein
LPIFVLVDGDPLADITILQDKANILMVMKCGTFRRTLAHWKHPSLCL